MLILALAMSCLRIYRSIRLLRALLYRRQPEHWLGVHSYKWRGYMYSLFGGVTQPVLLHPVQFQEAWLDRFEWEGISLNWETYTELIKFYTSRGELQEAFELSEMVAEGDAFETGPGAWLRQLEAAADQGSTEQVEKVALAMHRYCGSLGKTGRGLVKKALSKERVEVRMPPLSTQSHGTY
eukprot:s431_g7.t1